MMLANVNTAYQLHNINRHLVVCYIVNNYGIDKHIVKDKCLSKYNLYAAILKC